MSASPSPTHHHIVFLQADFCPIPDFRFPPGHTFTTTVYQQTSLSELHSRIHDASVVVFSYIPFDARTLSPEVTPHLKLIAVAAVGTDCIDLEACRKRGIIVSRSVGANVDSVSEHAIGLYFASRRRLLDMHMLTRAGEWAHRKGTILYQVLDKHGQPPLSCQDEVAGIIGNGIVGRRIAQLARNLGMKVLISARKDPAASAPLSTVDSIERTQFDTVIRRSTVIFVAVPLSPSTRNLISTPELETMSPHTVIVNVSRGGIVDEDALVEALRKGTIAGAATDVFREEPAGLDNSPLLADGTNGLNLIVTPHLAWLSKKTLANYSQMVQQAIEGWSAGEPCNVVT
ncbi:glycerate dehydrogenase [Aspergillus udagawae]|nr:glycerate dehydrogenase [Aspergillus udagawae]